MNAAFQNLMALAPANSRIASEIDIRVTHRYFRILPQDAEEELRLQTDTTLFLSDVPFDYAISEMGDYYHDPSIPDSLPTWKYVTVPVDYLFSDTLHTELLKEIYLPRVDMVDFLVDGDTIDESELFENKDMLLTILQHEAFSITQNEDGIIEEIDSSNVNTANGRAAFSIKRWVAGPLWNAGGSVRVWNTVTESFQGVNHAEVTVWKFYEYHTKYTFENGTVDFGKPFRFNANYTIKFKTEDFCIKEGPLNQAELRLNDVDRKFNYDLGTATNYANNDNWFHATIHNAAHMYYSKLCGQYGITKPRNVSIRAKQKAGRSNYFWLRGYILDSEINITDQFDDVPNHKNTEAVFGTVFHELTHAAHYRFEPGLFQLDDIIWAGIDEKELMAESWALGVEIVLINDLWHSSDVTSNKYKEFGQRERNQRGGEGAVDGYTSLVLDLIDNENNMTAFGTDDRVYGYNLDMIENALDESRSLGMWEKRIREIYVNPSEDFLDELFDSFFTK
jgi:hypothetical protein